MSYKSICSVCLREIEADDVFELMRKKNESGFVEVKVHFGFSYLRHNFCPACAKKPISVDQLKHMDNASEWSY